MNVLYICKVSAYQASGNQIDIPKKVAIDFFKVPESCIENSSNFNINICHVNDLRTFEVIEIQPATNLRFSTKLYTLLSNNGDRLSEGDLLVFEKLMRSFCVRCIKKDDVKYLPLIELFDEGEKHMLLSSSRNNQHSSPSISESFQQIYYGAPGTGKSHIINEQVCNESVIRTTFHPDSDYSTFVGCYKPTTKSVKMRDLAGHVIKENGVELTEDRIVYEFVEQAFLQAYIKAWKFYERGNEEVEKQFLVIEEINRGNCAQIFGDLFQLLDRNMWGFSDYPIQADNDMRKQLAKAFSGLEISKENKERINACYKGDKDYVKQVLEGEILLLPDNLFIWATMNTSDQSLFPIDSAFKRRWDWQYMPISKGRESGKDINWSIIANDNEYDWWSFLTKINEQIGSTTNSEDKKLGFFFCKAVDGKISADTFVGKVIFYLWNDVFKDFGFDNAIFNDEDGSTLSFDKFYATENGKVIVCKDKVEKFLKNLGVDAVEEAEDVDENEANDGTFTKRHLKVVYPDGRIVENNNSTTTLIEVINEIGPAKVAELNLKISGYPMISRERIENDDKGYRSSQREINDGYWIVTKFSTDAKLAKLQEISNRLNLGLQVSVEG